MSEASQASEYNRCAWREPPTIGAAVAYLAEELKDETRTLLCKQDRECLARMMIKCETGTVDTGCATVEWKHDENPSKDLLWRFAANGSPANKGT